MDSKTFRVPQQSRSQQTLERILASSTALIADKPYDSVSIAEIASSARVSVGGFYSRFENKEALLSALQSRFVGETQERIESTLARDLSYASLQELLRFIVSNNVELYEKYRGVLTDVFIRTRVLVSQENMELSGHNKNVVKGLEELILRKRDDIPSSQPRVAIRMAIACMTAMLRDAIVFGDRSFYPKPKNASVVSRHVARVMYHHLIAEPT